MGVQAGLYVESQEGVTWPAWQALARRAEALGFDHLSTSVHLGSLQAPGKAALDLWPVMTAVALWTERLRFGPHVLPATFYHPAQVARLSATLDRLSGGRFRLSLGAGRHGGEHRAFGLPFPPHDQRVAMLGEAVTVIRLLWGGGPVSYRGRWFRLENAHLQPVPAHPWLGLGGNSDPILRLAAEQADEWCTTGASLQELAPRLARLDELALAARRHPRAIRRTLMTGVLVGRDRAELERRALRVAELVPQLAGQAPEAILERLAGEWRWWVGAPERIVDQVRPLIRAGLDQVLFQVFDPGDLAALDLLAREVVPGLRA